MDDNKDMTNANPDDEMQFDLSEDDLLLSEDEQPDDSGSGSVEFKTLVSEGEAMVKIPENIGNPTALAETVIRILDSKKAHGLKLLHVGDKTVLADYFVLCTGTSNTQLRALSAALEDELGKAGITPGHIEGYNEASWIIMDYASVIVHIFNRETRNFYNLEKLWSEAEEIDISGLLD